VKSKLTICYDILREVRRIAPFVRNRRIVIEAHPDVVDLILDDEKESLDEIELMMSVNVEVTPNDTLHIHDYEVTPLD
jgi:ribonuclease G